jgi:hypothetical protein
VGWLVPVVCVLKGPNGQNGVRLAIDYRYANKFSPGSAYPITDVNEVIQKLGRVRFISRFDAKSAFWQIGLKAESQPLSAFVCDSALFESTRMPFGLKSASNTCVDVVSRILYLVRDFTAAFIDDMAELHTISKTGCSVQNQDGCHANLNLTYYAANSLLSTGFSPNFASIYVT